MKTSSKKTRLTKPTAATLAHHAEWITQDRMLAKEGSSPSVPANSRRDCQQNFRPSAVHSSETNGTTKQTEKRRAATLKMNSVLFEWLIFLCRKRLE